MSLCSKKRSAIIFGKAIRLPGNGEKKALNYSRKSSLRITEQIKKEVLYSAT